MRRVWILPDAHAEPNEKDEFERFAAVGRFVARRFCDYDLFVCLGDFADMPSLASQAKAGELEGDRCLADICAARQAARKLAKGFGKRWNARSASLLLGNHEDRAWRFEAENPKLEGTLTTALLGAFESAGCFGSIVPYPKVLRFGQLIFAHHLRDGSGRAVASVSKLPSRAPRAAGIFVGHSHVVGLDVRAGICGKVWAVSCGCFVDPSVLTSPPKWAESVSAGWWSGIVCASVSDAMDEVLGVDFIPYEEVVR